MHGSYCPFDRGHQGQMGQVSRLSPVSHPFVMTFVCTEKEEAVSSVKT